MKRKRHRNQHDDYVKVDPRWCWCIHGARGILRRFKVKRIVKR